MKTQFLVTLEGTLPVLATINVEAETESEAIMLAERIAESQNNGVKTRALDIEIYPADYFIVEGVADISQVAPKTANQKVWTRDEIKGLLEPKTASGVGNGSPATRLLR